MSEEKKVTRKKITGKKENGTSLKNSNPTARPNQTNRGN